MSLSPEIASPEIALLAARFTEIRHHTLALVEGLSAEDRMVQLMPDASPVKWHLAHTTWFFETFVLEPAESAQATGFTPFDVAFRMLSRPSFPQVLAYRHDVEVRIHRPLGGHSCGAHSQQLPQFFPALCTLAIRRFAAGT